MTNVTDKMFDKLNDKIAEARQKLAEARRLQTLSEQRNQRVAGWK